MKMAFVELSRTTDIWLPGAELDFGKDETLLSRMELTPSFHTNNLWIVCERTYNSQHCEGWGHRESLLWSPFYLPAGCLKMLVISELAFKYSMEKYNLYEMQGTQMKIWIILESKYLFLLEFGWNVTKCCLAEQYLFNDAKSIQHHK